MRSQPKIITQVKVANALDSSKCVEITARVDINTPHLTLPRVWKSKLGALETVVTDVEFETSTQEICAGEICGPVKAQVGNFRPVAGEVLFVDMKPNEEGDYEPLIGYLMLAAIPVAVDMPGHRLVKVRPRI